MEPCCTTLNGIESSNRASQRRRRRNWCTACCSQSNRSWTRYHRWTRRRAFCSTKRINTLCIIWKLPPDWSEFRSFRPSFRPSNETHCRFSLRFVLNTDTAATAVKEFLQQYYAKIWMEFVVKNPLWSPGMPVTSDLFKQKSDQFIRQSALFTSKTAWIGCYQVEKYFIKFQKYFLECARDRRTDFISNKIQKSNDT